MQGSVRIKLWLIWGKKVDCDVMLGGEGRWNWPSVALWYEQGRTVSSATTLLGKCKMGTWTRRFCLILIPTACNSPMSEVESHVCDCKPFSVKQPNCTQPAAVLPHLSGFEEQSNKHRSLKDVSKRSQHNGAMTGQLSGTDTVKLPS
jgi:hypothetical protein